MNTIPVTGCIRAVFFAIGFIASHALPAQERVSFQAQPVAAQHTFHVGERIPLELSFSSLAKDRFEITMASSDRSGRTRYEEFDVSPKAGWSDPLEQYFSAGYVGGGLSSTGVLTSTPTIVSIDLNEWIRFDQPGTYRVVVSSHRVADLTKKRTFNGDSPDPIKAKPVLLHIISATPQWRAAKLRAAMAQLVATPVVQGLRPAARKDAIADLRFLGTKAAVEELAANLREDRPDMMYQSAFGLIGVEAQMREVASQAMQQRLDDTSFPVCNWFIETMAVLDAYDDSPSGITFESRSQSKEVWRKVLRALPRKEGKARAETAQTLLSNPPADINAESRAELARVLSASFLDLTEEQKAQQLTWQWDLLRSESMLPALQGLSRLALSRPGSNVMSRYSRRELKSIALARWYELDPAGATQEVLSQIGSSAPSLTAQSLAFMPKLELPQYEPTWAQRFIESSDYEEEAVLGGLLVRFGTGSALAEIANKLRVKVGHWECAPQNGALAYMVKFNPEQARTLLREAVDASGPGKTGCSQELFQDVSVQASGAVLTDVAVATLDNANLRSVMDALIYLADYGREEDQQPIWNRYVKWHEQWSGKADILDSPDRASLEKIYLEIGVGQNLARALIANQGWLADQDLITRVIKMCVGQQVCQHVEQVAAEGPSPYHVSAYRNASLENYRIGQYTAKSMELLGQKIAQYPKGTMFQLIQTSPQNEDQKALESKVRELFERYGMSLQAASN